MTGSALLTIGALCAGGLAGLVVALRGDHSSERQRRSEADGLRERHRDALALLRQLDLDRDRLSADAYASERDRLIQHAADLLRRLDALGEEMCEPEGDPNAADPPAAPSRSSPIGRLAWSAALVGFGFTLAFFVQRDSTARRDGMGPTGGSEGGPAQVMAPPAEDRPLPDDLEGLNAAASEALQHQEWGRALAATQRALAIDANNPDARSHHAFLLAVIGRIDQALAELDELLDERPEMNKALTFRAVIALQAGRLDVAETSIAKALARASPDTVASLQAIARRISEARAANNRDDRPATAEEAPTSPRPGAEIRGELVLAEKVDPASLRGKTVFVIARVPGRPSGPPLAVRRLVAQVWPLPFTIGPGDIMAGGQWPASVVLSARLDGDGNPMTRDPSDLAGALATPVAAGEQGVRIELRPSP